MNSDFFPALKEFTDLLNHCSIQFMVTGGLAQNVYIKPRPIRDIDIVIDYKKEQLECLIPALDCHFEYRRIYKKVDACGMFDATHIKTQKKIDIIICKSNEFNQLEFQNRTIKNILGLNLNCVVAEDLIISKLNWIQEFKLENQINDLKQVICHQGLDWEYIRFWCNRLQLKTYGLFNL